MNNYKTRETVAALEIVLAIADTIRALGEVPSGHLYARLMGRMTIDQYNVVIDALVRAEVVKRDDCHMLTWIGPAPKVN